MFCPRLAKPFREGVGNLQLSNLRRLRPRLFGHRFPRGVDSRSLRDADNVLEMMLQCSDFSAPAKATSQFGKKPCMRQLPRPAGGGHAATAYHSSETARKWDADDGLTQLFMLPGEPVNVTDELLLSCWPPQSSSVIMLILSWNTTIKRHCLSCSHDLASRLLVRYRRPAARMETRHLLTD